MHNAIIDKHKQKTFYQIIGLGLTGLGLVVFLMINSVSYLLPKVATIDALCGCSDMVTSSVSFGSQNYFAMVLLFVLSLFLLFTLYKISKILYTTLKFTKTFLAYQTEAKSKRLVKIAHSLDIEDKIVQIGHIQPIVFCHNFLKPKICISQKLVQDLTDNELIAVLLHEKKHLQSHEPVKIFLVKSISLFLFFVPALSLLSKKYLTLSEISADEYVVENFEKVHLASALYKMLNLDNKILMQKNLALSFFSIMGSRVEYLAEENVPRKTRHLFLKTMVSLIFLFTFLSSFGWFLYSDKQTSQTLHNTECAPSDPRYGCEATVEPECTPDYSSVDTSCINQAVVLSS